MINEININSINLGDTTPVRPGSRRTAGVDKQAGADLEINFDRLIEQAVKMPAEDLEAVHKAQELLRSGRLDDPANIRQAAENILKFGI